MLKKFHVRAILAWSSVLILSAASLSHAKPPAKARRAKTQLASVGVASNAETGFEKSLLGVRILQNYKVALAKLGQPDRIFRADEYIDFAFDYDAKGAATGGITDIISGGDVQKDMIAGGDAPAPAAPPGDPNGDNPEDPAGNGLNASGSNGGLNSATQDKAPETFGQSGGYRWAYLNRLEKKVYLFDFNRDGRMIWAMEGGLGTGSPTRRGINLGSPLRDVYARYGWPDSVQQTKEGMQLFYDIKHHCQFDITNNKVTGIYIVLAEGMKIRKVKDHNSNGGNGGGAPGGGGGGGGAAPPPKRPDLGGGGGG